MINPHFEQRENDAIISQVYSEKKPKIIFNEENLIKEEDPYIKKLKNEILINEKWSFDENEGNNNSN